MIDTRPTHEPDQFHELIKAELPGIDFRISRSDSSFVTELEWQRRVEGYRAAVTDERDLADPAALHFLTMRAIDAYREKAMQDYGLRAILEREKKEAFTKGFRAMAENIEGYVNSQMINYVTVLDEDGEEKEVPAGPTWEGQRILAWLSTLSGTKTYGSWF